MFVLCRLADRGEDLLILLSQCTAQRQSKLTAKSLWPSSSAAFVFSPSNTVSKAEAELHGWMADQPGLVSWLAEYTQHLTPSLNTAPRTATPPAAGAAPSAAGHYCSGNTLNYLMASPLAFSTGCAQSIENLKCLDDGVSGFVFLRVWLCSFSMTYI